MGGFIPMRLSVLPATGGQANTTGSGSVNQVTVWASSSSLTGFSTFTYDGTGLALGTGAVSSTNRFSMRHDQASTTALQIRNSSASSSASARLSLVSDAGSWDLYSTSTAQGANCFIDSPAGFTGGLTLLVNANAPITFSTNGTSRGSISGAGVLTVSYSMNVINSSSAINSFVNPTAAPFIIKSLTGNSNGLRLYSNTATDVASVINGYNANLEFGANSTVYGTVSGSGGWTLGASGNTVSHIFRTDNIQCIGSTSTGIVYINRGTTAAVLRVGGGTGADGGEIGFFGSAHATAPNEIRFYNNGTLAGVIDTNSLWTIGTGTATTHRLNITLQSTVGAAGGASALPATPTGYVLINLNGTNRAIPYYAAS